jgi:hypothetical protein
MVILRGMSRTAIRVLVESTPKKVFVSALDWPGLSRGGKTEEAALESLLAHVERYAPVARAAGHPLPDANLKLEVAERIDGDAGTAFGMPSVVAAADRLPVDEAEAAQLAALVEAAWAAFDQVAAVAPPELRKGPRGGGRDTAKIVEHVHGGDEAYASVLGIPPAERRPAAVGRAAVLAVLRQPSDGSPIAGRKWPPRYAARRIAWHAVDHAWEIEDRTDPGEDRTEPGSR